MPEVDLFASSTMRSLISPARLNPEMPHEVVEFLRAEQRERLVDAGMTASVISIRTIRLRSLRRHAVGNPYAQVVGEDGECLVAEFGHQRQHVPDPW